MKTAILGFLTPIITYIVITLLHYILPSKKIKGYVKNDKTGEILSYRINGLPVLIISILIWFFLGKYNIVPFDWFYTIRWWSLAGAIAIGLLFSILIVLKYPRVKNNFFADLFLGRVKNPQIEGGIIDIKMWLYLIGAIMLQINVLSFTTHHFIAVDDFNPGVILCAAMLTYFIWDYLIFERVHLYTYDFIAERVGLKLGFGCLTFYPYFYLISLWAIINKPNSHISAWVTMCFSLVFVVGWVLARGANMQKYYFKTSPSKIFLGIKPKTITDGKKSILINGFWGLSRHINYLGEILMGCGIALSAGYAEMWIVWLYPAYYVALLFTRQVDDDKICKEKYGKIWDEYTKAVKYRIIPGIY